MVINYIILEKTEDSRNFRTNRSVLHKQGWAFRDLQNFCVILASKKEVARYIAKTTEVLCILVRYTDMNKTKVEIYKGTLRDVLANFDGAEKFIKERIEETLDRKKISVEDVTCSFFVYVDLCYYCYSMMLTCLFSMLLT